MLFYLPYMCLWGGCFGIIALVICLVRRKSKADTIYAVLFAAYLGALIDFSLISGGTLSERRVQLVPFVTLFLNLSNGRVYYLKTMLVELAKFAPLGVLLGIKKIDPKKTLLIGASASLLIEICQLITMHGVCDIDDVMLNIAGTAIGLLLLRKEYKKQ